MPVTKVRTANDPHDLERRLETLIHLHLLDIEENPEMFASKDRLATIQCVGMFLNRKYGWGEVEGEGVGSAVRKYSGAFRTPPHVTGGRATGARSPRDRVSGGAYSDTNPEDDAS